MNNTTNGFDIVGWVLYCVLRPFVLTTEHSLFVKVQHSENIKFKSALQRIVSLFVTLSDTGSEGYLYAYQVHFQQNRQYVHIRDYFFCVFIKKPEPP